MLDYAIESATLDYSSSLRPSVWFGRTEDGMSRR
jgi:hypothetical protein